MIIADLNTRDDLSFTSDSSDVHEIKENLKGLKIDAEEYDSFFVKVGEGEFIEVYGIEGIIPYLHKTVTRLL